MVFAGAFRDPNVCSRRDAQPRTLVGREAPVGDRAAPQILYRPPGLHHAVIPVTGRAEQQVPQLVRSDVRFGRLFVGFRLQASGYGRSCRYPNVGPCTRVACDAEIAGQPRGCDQGRHGLT